MTNHLPPQASELFDCSDLGCGRIGETKFRNKGGTNAYIRNVYDKDVSNRSRAARVKIGGTSPAEEDVTRSRAKRIRGGTMTPIPEFTGGGV